MAIITIDDVKYELDQLSDESKAQLVNIQFIDTELQRLHAKIAVMQTARMSYSKALNETLPKTFSGDSIKFS